MVYMEYQIIRSGSKFCEVIQTFGTFITKIKIKQSFVANFAKIYDCVTTLLGPFLWGVLILMLHQLRGKFAPVLFGFPHKKTGDKDVNVWEIIPGPTGNGWECEREENKSRCSLPPRELGHSLEPEAQTSSLEGRGVWGVFVYAISDQSLVESCSPEHHFWHTFGLQGGRVGASSWK